jgi:ubiquinone/menaquinone biosynthesis C-methylase UbiE
MQLGYDRFASFYDLALERLYRPYRAELARRAALQPGEVVLDLACGTGQNLDHLLPAVLPGGQVVGVDLSEGMLSKAQARAERLGAAQSARFLCSDARTLPRDTVQPDVVVVALGLTVIPQWESVFEATFDLLRPGGRYLVLDVHAQHRVLQTTLVEWFAEADVSRRTWEPLERASRDFSLHWTQGSPHVFGGKLFIARGVRP